MPTKEEVAKSNSKLLELSKQLEAQARELDASKAELLEKARLESDLEAATKEKSALQGDLHASREALKIEQAHKVDLQNELEATWADYDTRSKGYVERIVALESDLEAATKAKSRLEWDMDATREAFEKEKTDKARLEANLKDQALEFQRSKEELEEKVRSQELDSEARLKSQAEELHASKAALLEKARLESDLEAATKAKFALE